MNIIVTTPKSQMANAAKEAAECLDNGGGSYFRRFSLSRPPTVTIDDRVYYVEDGFIRGFAVITGITNIPRCMQCDTSGRWYDPGFYIFMPAESWRWIRPIPMRGFQGFRYLKRADELCGHEILDADIIGNWRDSKPVPGKNMIEMKTSCDM